MAFLDDLGKRFTEASQAAIAKTKDFADVAKMNSSVSEEEKKIVSEYMEIGKKYVEKHADDYEEEFKDNILRVVEAQEKIKEYQQVIQNIKKIGKCPNCGIEIQQNAAFCTVCGTAIEHDDSSTKEIIQDEKHCYNCGARLSEGDVFCIKCGTKVVE